MDFLEACSVKISEFTPDQSLNDAWLAIGRHKLHLRQMAYRSKNVEKSLTGMRQAFHDANIVLDRILNEMHKRQIFDWYYSKPLSYRKRLPPPVWVVSENSGRPPLT